ncbi:hypothetical protein MRS76_25980 [Rhizobiaceae bacterium n13]|uniref:Uncharacterized protein n=1 Tax=Ferirhizobium litorale TaxID=2927786 RepID=A0AAE3QIT7_9HYPH|nr:hypothetical protein [Fererhizobium litorale]MDI7865338.1 hypothetical protein [Fererhizobium litorale]MDI7924735.1 hypothetical protein [Fererhizobium litorale]
MENWDFYFEGLKAIGSISSQPKYQGVVGFLYEWQTLVSGSIALTAGALVYGQLRVQRQQLENDRLKHRDLLKRQERAARIRIPHALAELSEFVEEGLKLWVAGSKLNALELPTKPVDTLMAVAEWLDEASYESVHELVSALQVFQSRHLEPGRSYFGRGQPGKDLAVLAFHIDRLFPFGRLKNDEPVHFVRPNRDDIAATLQRYHSSLVLHAGSETVIKQRVQQVLNLLPDPSRRNDGRAAHKD